MIEYVVSAAGRRWSRMLWFPQMCMTVLLAGIFLTYIRFACLRQWGFGCRCFGIHIHLLGALLSRTFLAFFFMSAFTNGPVLSRYLVSMSF